MSDEEERPPSRAGVLAAVVVLVVLVAAGLWITRSLVSMVRQQDCVMSGRRDCLQVPGQ